MDESDHPVGPVIRLALVVGWAWLALSWSARRRARVALHSTVTARLGRRGHVGSRRRAHWHVENEAPSALDLLAVLLRGGVPPASALVELASVVDPWAAPWATRIARRLQRGERLADATDVVAAEQPDAVRAALLGLGGSFRSAGDAAMAAHDAARSCRSAVRRRREARVRRAGVAILLPLTVCVLPAVVLVVVVPLLAGLGVTR